MCQGTAIRDRIQEQIRTKNIKELLYDKEDNDDYYEYEYYYDDDSSEEDEEEYQYGRAEKRPTLPSVI